MQSHNSNPKTNLKLRAYNFSIDIIRLISVFPNHKVYSIIQDQLLRSATSIGANIVEAKSSSSKKDFIKFYDIALKSANETQYWLCLVRDSTDFGKKNQDKIQKKIDEAVELSNMLGSSLLTMKNRKSC